MKPHIFFVTGTDTGIGKTALATMLTRYLHACGAHVAALKPVCSGGRDDALALWIAAGRILCLNTVNPWYFRESLAPVLAARRVRQRVTLASVVDHLRDAGRGFEIIVVEGAGGVLSPMGEDFSSRELIIALKATPIVVAPNRLGVVNQVRLTLEVLPARIANRAQIVLFDPPHLDMAARTNPALISEFIEANRLHRFPWLRENLCPADVPLRGRLQIALQALTRGVM